MSNQARIEELQAFISSNPDAREMRKVLALKLVYQDSGYQEIERILDVSSGSISRTRGGAVLVANERQSFFKN